MSNGFHPYPYFWLEARPVPELKKAGRRDWVVFAETTVCLGVGRGSSRWTSERLKVRLDSAAFVSLLPEDWASRPTQARFLKRTSTQLPFQTAAGRGEGTLLSADVDTVFVTDPRQQGHSFDWLVTPNLNGRGFGLVALRDLVGRFFLRAEGTIELDANDWPTVLPDLELVPRDVWDRVRYHCPSCGIVAWGRAGLNLVCGDHNVRLVQG
jgi:hypothetical protein